MLVTIIYYLTHTGSSINRRMNLYDIPYAALNFTYDHSRVAEEILAHDLVQIPASQRFLAHRTFDLVEPLLYDQVTVVTETGIREGTIPSWHGYSFTHVPGVPFSQYGGNAARIQHEQWQWKPHARCDYIKEITEQLGFTQVQNVRAMLLDPPGFGPVHCDLPPGSDYYQRHVSVTLNVQSGGQPLIAEIGGVQQAIDAPCFMFRDDCWHGVGQVSSRRIQLRINGLVDQDRLARWLP